MTRGNPESPLRWTCKGTATLADELTRLDHPVSDHTVAALPKQAGYSGVCGEQHSPVVGADGAPRFPRARTVSIAADGGGGNGPRSRLWKWSLQQLADALDLTLCACHFPPGTSKWNKIEHRPFSFISQNWRGHPLTSFQVLVNLIANTTTRIGLLVKAALDTRHYETALHVSDAELAQLRLTPHDFHEDWNYTISPRRKL